MHEEVVLLFYHRIEADGAAPDNLGAWWVFVKVFVPDQPMADLQRGAGMANAIGSELCCLDLDDFSPIERFRGNRVGPNERHIHITYILTTIYSE